MKNKTLLLLPLLLASAIHAQPPADPVLKFRDHSGRDIELTISKNAAGARCFAVRRPLQSAADVIIEQASAIPAAGKETIPSYAAVLSVHPQIGTAYEIAVARRISWSATTTVQSRYYVSHSPQAGWKFLGSADADFAGPRDMESNMKGAAVANVIWASAYDGPTIVMTDTVTFSSAKESKQQRPALTTMRQVLIGGPCQPMRPTLIVEKEDSIPAIAARLVAWSGAESEKNYDRAAHEKIVVAAIKHLNSDLGDKTVTGSRLIIPTPREINALFGGKIDENHLPVMLRGDLATLSCPTPAEAACLAMIVSWQSQVEMINVGATLKQIARVKSLAPVDLNDDDLPDYIADLGPRIWYKPDGGDMEANTNGAHSTQWAVILAEKDNTYRVLSMGEGVYPWVLKSHSKGLHDLQTGAHEAGPPGWKLQFDGVTYR